MAGIGNPAGSSHPASPGLPAGAPIAKSSAALRVSAETSWLRVALVVCGKFHYFNYVRLLDEAGILSQFIFSHRVGATRRLGGSKRFINLFLKEYIFQLHTRLLGERLANTIHPLYHWQWDMSVAMALAPCDVLHFLMHGNCRRTIGKARALGAVCLGEAVNSHPDDYQAEIDREFDDLGLPGLPHHPRFVERIKDEIPLADRIVVPSTFVEKSYLRHGIPPAKICRIPYGANLDDFAPGAGGGAVFKVACVGLVTLRKGHQYLLRAWKQLNLPHAELHCFGFVDRTVIARLRAIGAPRVYFHGSVSKSELIRHLQGSDAFVLPTVEDGFGVAILEAMACALPVIVTDHSGGPDIITDGTHGYVVAARSVDSLAARLEQLYSDRIRAREMGRAGRRVVENQYNWPAYVARLVEYYHECADGRTPRSS